jgi:hypothetical protein
MNVTRHEEIMAHVEVQFKPQWKILRDKHNQELREAQFRARKTNNRGAMLPVEAECYVAHAKAIVITKANYIAEAYTAFNEPAGREADAELARFFVEVVAGRKSSFQGEIENRSLRTRESYPQLPFILRGFEREANEALLVGRAILDKQRMQLRQKAYPPKGDIKYVVDTSVFNWLVNGRIKKENLPLDGGFAITHIQADELSATEDKERRVRLWLMQSDLHCRLIPTQSFAFGLSRWDHAKWSDGKLCQVLKNDLDALNRKENNLRDALIAEASIANGYTLITADKNLKLATEKNGGKVLYFSA